LHNGIDMRRTLGFVLGVSLTVLGAAPRTVYAVTVDEIVALAKSGVSDRVILALIERDKTVFTIEPDQLVKLQRDGLSEAVILAMLKSGRAEGDAQARADAAQNAARIESALSTTPEVVVLGHGPDWPNVSRDLYSAPVPLDVVPAGYGLPYAIPIPVHVPRQRARRPGASSFTRIPTSPTLCIEHPSSSPVPPAVGSQGFVTVCPSGFR
jgi:hypothetical protein